MTDIAENAKFYSWIMLYNFENTESWEHKVSNT